jgi:hypothetical protein
MGANPVNQLVSNISFTPFIFCLVFQKARILLKKTEQSFFDCSV